MNICWQNYKRSKKYLYCYRRMAFRSIPSLISDSLTIWTIIPTLFFKDLQGMSENRLSWAADMTNWPISFKLPFRQSGLPLTSMLCWKVHNINIKLTGLRLISPFIMTRASRNPGYPRRINYGNKDIGY